MTSLPCTGSASQGVVAFDIGSRFLVEDQGLRGVHGENRRRLAVHQPMQEVEDVGRKRGKTPGD
jgi:hypothetical protein